MGRGGHWFTPDRTSDYESSIRVYARQAIGRSTWGLLGSFEVECVFFLPSRLRKDVDNCAKAVLDGLNGVAWADDNQVTDLVIRKRCDTKAPRTEVTIRHRLDEVTAA
jgi:crossover junction endodeoxyribonuclease RusA